MCKKMINGKSYLNGDHFNTRDEFLKAMTEHLQVAYDGSIQLNNQYAAYLIRMAILELESSKEERRPQ